MLTSVADANIGSIMGIGFPAWTGGVLQYINGYEGGLPGFVARARELAERYGERFTPPALLVEKAEQGEKFSDAWVTRRVRGPSREPDAPFRGLWPPPQLLLSDRWNAVTSACTTKGCICADRDFIAATCSGSDSRSRYGFHTSSRKSRRELVRRRTGVLQQDRHAPRGWSRARSVRPAAAHPAAAARGRAGSRPSPRPLQDAHGGEPVDVVVGQRPARAALQLGPGRLLGGVRRPGGDQCTVDGEIVRAQIVAAAAADSARSRRASCPGAAAPR